MLVRWLNRISHLSCLGLEVSLCGLTQIVEGRIYSYKVTFDLHMYAIVSTAFMENEEINAIHFFKSNFLQYSQLVFNIAQTHYGLAQKF